MLRFTHIRLSLLAGIYLLATSVFAQIDNPKSKSKLDIKPKNKVEFNFDKSTFSILAWKPTQQTGLDRQLSVRTNSEAINQFFKNAITLNKSTQKPTVKPAAVENTVPVVNASFERNEERRSEDHLIVSDRITATNLYPNPADDYTEIEYSISQSVNDARLSFYNVLGTEVKGIELDKNEKKVRIPTRDMNSGIYLYQLSVDGKSMVTKKLIVRH
jgi:hypothetical protein